MSSFIFLKNFYLEEIQQITQDYINLNYVDNLNFSAEILMKNSRSYFITFNEELATEELLDWINTFHLNQSNNERTTLIEGFLTINSIDYKFYFTADDIYGINSNNQSYKIEDLEELVLIKSKNQEFNKIEIPTKNIHSMDKISFYIPKKKWWKFW